MTHPNKKATISGFGNKAQIFMLVHTFGLRCVYLCLLSCSSACEDKMPLSFDADELIQPSSVLLKEKKTHNVKFFVQGAAKTAICYQYADRPG